MRREESPPDVASEVAHIVLWYHTMELAPGVVTPGYFDLRPVVSRIPWPELCGKRCLDIGTYDGFFAFEMERRGAAEVVATDVASHEDWDWPPAQRVLGPQRLAVLAGEKGAGFEVARRALGSHVRREFVSVYDLSPERLGTFDVVFCGSLLLHLRDPFRALEAIARVCRGDFVSSEQIDARLTLLHPRAPLTSLNGMKNGQWHVPNLAGFRRMIRAAGFEIVKATRPFRVPFGPGHPRFRRRPPLGTLVLRTLVTGGDGVPHAAVLARAPR